MILLDEQVRTDQRLVLTRWRIPFRQIGTDIAPSGIKDENIVPFLLTLKRPTLFTHDHGFFEPRLAHSGYCLVLLAESDVEAAFYTRRFLRHSRFNTNAKRMGVLARVHHEAIHFWQRGNPILQRADWPPSR
jgi:hypothetical protein